MKRFISMLLAALLVVQCGWFVTPTVSAAEEGCPYCEYTLAEDGTVIHSEDCNADYVYDGTADLEKYVELSDMAIEYGIDVSGDPANETSLLFYSYEFGENTVMQITGWYWDPGTSGLWYSVELYSGAFPEGTEDYAWPETPWILQTYTNDIEGFGYSLDFVEIEEPDEPEIPSVDASVTDSEGNELTDSEGNPITVTVSGETLPDGAEVVATVPTVNGERLEGVFDIKVLVDGVEWQPIDEGKAVTVTIPVGTLEDGWHMEVYHFIETPKAFEKHELGLVPIDSLSNELTAQLGNAAEAAELAGYEGYVAYEYCGSFFPTAGVISFTADSFSVYYFNGTEYTTGDAGVESNPANLCGAFDDDGKYYFINRGDYIYFFGTNDWTISEEAFESVEKTDTQKGVGNWYVYKAKVKDTARFYNQGYQITRDGWLSDSSINIVVMPTLTIKFESHLTDWESFITVPADVTNVFMGNCAAADHDPANGLYGALNYTLEAAEVIDEVDGYYFQNWYVKHAPERTFEAGEVISLSDETLQVDLDDDLDSYTVTLVANFTYDPHKITYVDPEGFLTNETVEYLFEESYTVKNPSYEGYTFLGWNLTTEDPVESWTEAFGTTVPGGSTVTNMYGDITLTASWEANDGTPYSVQHWFQNAALDGYDVSSDVDTLYGTTGEDTEATKVQRSVIGYELENFETKEIAGDGSTIVIIRYKRVTTTITFVDPHDGTTLGSVSGVYGTAVPNFNDPTKTNYAFMGWYTADNPNGLYTPTTMPATDLTLYAKWNIKKAVITFVDPTNNNNVLYVVNEDAGTVVPAPTVTKEGYTLDGWYTDADYADAFDFPYTLKGDDDITLYAKWTINVYAVTFVDYDGKVLKTETVTHGGSATAPTDPVCDGYKFTGWDTDFSRVTSDLTVTATYTQVVSVTIEWGSLVFVYTQGAWNPQTHTYAEDTLEPETDSANLITVTNSTDSTIAVNVSIAYASVYNSISGSFTVSPASDGAAPPEKTELAIGASEKYWLWLTGSLDEPPADGVVGTVTVTIE